MSPHAQIGPQGAEKQQRKVSVGDGMKRLPVLTDSVDLIEGF